MQRITKKPDERRKEIMDAAMQLFSEKGYDKTSMLDITNSINVSAGLCYRYFKSKVDIYNAAMDLYIDQGVDVFLSLLGNEEQSIIEVIDTMPPLNKIKVTDNPYHNFFNAPNNSHFHMQMELALIERLIPILAKRLEHEQSMGRIMIENPTSTATFFLYGQLGIWGLNDMSDDIKIKEIQKYTKKLLGV